MGTFLQDLRYGARALLKTPGFTIVAVLSLALGIGANVNGFTTIQSLLLRPLPVSDPQDLVSLFSTQSGRPPGANSYADYLDYRGLAQVFSGVAAHQDFPVRMSDAGRPELLWGALVSANYFDVLKAEPALGRTFIPGEDTPGLESEEGSKPVAVLSHNFWQRRFHSDPAVLGESLRLNGRTYSIVGVAPRHFLGTRLFAFAPDVFVPLGMHAEVGTGTENPLEERNFRWLHVVGRLRPGVTREQAQAAASTLAEALEREHPASNRGVGVRVYDNRTAINPWVLDPATTRRMAFLLMVALLLVLLIACANVASLQLARATDRRREIAIRLSIGSSRGRLVRQLLTEGLLLAVAGGAAGFLLALWILDLSQALQPTLDFRTAFDMRVDDRVVVFTALLTLLTPILFGLAPALQATRPELVPALKDQASELRRSRSRLREVLVVGQMALSLVLLIGAGLFTRSFQNAQAVPPGFDPRGVLRVSMDLGLQGYNEERQRQFHERLLQRVQALPGVKSAALAFPLPLDAYANSADVTIEGLELAPGESPPEVFYSIVDPGYFQTMRTSLVGGRAFEERDRAGAPGVVIVNETFARRFWPEGDALGKRIRLKAQEPFVQIVGIARDGKYLTLGEDARPYLFAPLAQNPSPRISLLVRTTGEPERSAPSVRGVVESLDSELPLFGVKTLEEHMETPLSGAESGVAVVGFLGLVALTLSAAGIYGVVSYAAAQRTKEIGIRVALGARRRDVLNLVVGRGALLAAIGIGVGLVGALFVGRLLAGFLYGVSGKDPLTFVLISLGLAAVAILASYVPARRATRVDPLIALRAE